MELNHRTNRSTNTMRTLLRSIAFALAAYFGSESVAQGVTISGTVTPCVGVSYPVVFVQNTVPPVVDTVWTGPNCAYSYTFFPTDTSGTVFVSTSCDGGITWVTATGSWNPFFPNIFLNLSCTSGPCLLESSINALNSTPWEVVFSVNAGGGTLPYQYEWILPDGSVSTQSIVNWIAADTGSYTACVVVTDADSCVAPSCFTFYMDADGNMITNSWPPCQACVNIVQPTNGPAGPPIPWALEAVNCSSGGLQPVEYGYQWSTGETTQQITANGPGQYTVCIFMTDSTGCQETTCDSVMVDTNGIVNGGGNVPCEAGFWVMQAYEIDSTNPNGTGTPIPNLLWIWNLSSGGNGNFTFVWSWGDGTPNSTDPYPTHVYANGGPYNLCLTILDTDGCTDIACDSVSVDGNGFYTGMILDEEVSNSARSGFTVSVLNQLPTLIDEQPAIESLLAWPNPVEDMLSLRFNTTVNGLVPMTITDMSGRAVRAENVNINAGGNDLQVAVDDLAPGLYLMRFGNDAKAVALRFVKR